MAGISCGIVGLPNIGKSTLFNAITKAGAEAANYPFCTIEPNVGIVTVPDQRVKKLKEIVQPNKTIYATIEFVDIAGLVKGASQGEGQGNQFLDNIHHTDAIIHVVRCFDDDNVVHVHGKVDPLDDIKTINLELILSDIQTIETICERLKKKARNEKDAQQTTELLQTKLLPHLEQEKMLSTLKLSEDELKLIKPYRILTQKPILYAMNISENDLPQQDNQYTKIVRKFAEENGTLAVPICAKIEDEIAQLDDEDTQMFLDDLGIKQSGLERLIQTSYKKLGLATYLTAGKEEVRAWTITANTTAPKAAAVIHTDFEKGFIRAEVTKFNDIARLGSQQVSKEAGLMNIEGKDYLVQDGDVIFFRVSTK